MAIAYHVASRLAYVLYIGVALTRQRRDAVFTSQFGVEGGFERFRSRAAFFMNNDALSFVVLCLATRGTLHTPLPATVLLGTGILLVLIGLGMKLWAAATLGRRAYYWYDFFAEPPARPSSQGPYRFIRNPMYTLGYVQTYGLALLLGSLPGLVAGLFDQVAILAFHNRVEKPHVHNWTPPPGVPLAGDGDGGP